MKQADDIISLPIELREDIADSKFRLVHITANRVRQLSDNAPFLVATKSIKDTTVAIEESMAGMLKVIVGEEAIKAKEEYRKKQEREKMEEQLSAKEEEIRKELSAYLSEARSESESDEEGQADVGDEGVEEEEEFDAEPDDEGDAEEKVEE